MATLECVGCGQAFQDRRRTRRGPPPKYCSDECRRIATGQQHDPSAEQTCAHCGSSFTGRKRQYCCHTCKNEAHNKRRRLSRPLISNHRGWIAPANKFRCSRCRSIKHLSEAVPGRGGRPGYCRDCKQEERRRQAKREGREYAPISHIRQRAWDNAQRRLAEQNARQAWQHWLYVRAPHWWLDGYYAASDKPWTDHRLSRGRKETVRRQHDPEFWAKRKTHYKVRKRNRRGYAKTWHDGTVDEKALRSERKTCPYCGDKLTGKNVTLDHLDPVGLQGIHSASNLAPCCRDCNNAKGALPFTEWLERLSPDRHRAAARLYRRKRGAPPDQSTLPGF